MPFEFKVPVCKCRREFLCKRCGSWRHCTPGENRHDQRLCCRCCTELAYFSDKALPNQRIGDPQRNPIEQMLTEASVGNFLTEEEYGERMIKLQAARYQKDLDKITADLQKVSYPVQLQQAGIERMRQQAVRQHVSMMPLWAVLAFFAFLIIMALVH